MRKGLVLALLVAALTVAAGILGSGRALAYGHADQPVAQVEISGNCDNPTFDLCANEVGLGGVWTWSELDTNAGSATLDDPSPMDFTAAFCGHTGPGGGPHSSGGFGHPGQGLWYETGDLGAALAAGGFPFFDMSKSYSSYYVLDFFPGTGSDDFIAIVPAQYGHYGVHPAAAVSIQTQVAP
jgi:hypothetical protein